jgi:hypothetical protein
MNPLTHFIGFGDVYTHIWNLWYFHQSVMSARLGDLIHSKAIFFPNGASFINSLYIFNGLISYPVYLLFGSIAAYNFVVLFATVTTFIGIFMFLKLLTNDKTASIIAAFFYTFSFHRLMRLFNGQLPEYSAQWVGFFLFFFFQRFQFGKGKKNLFMAVGFFVLEAYTDYRTFIILALMTFFLFIHFAYQYQLKSRIKRYLKDTLFFTGLTLMMIFPLILLTRSFFGFSYKPDLVDRQIIDNLMSADLSGFFMVVRRPISVYLGWFTLVLCSIYLFFSKKSPKEFVMVKLWLYIGGFFLLLSMGPSIKFFGTKIYSGILMPYNILTKIPPLELFHIPHRFILGVNLALAVLATMSLKQIIGRLDKKYHIFLITGFLFLGMWQNKAAFGFFQINTYRHTALLERLKSGEYGSVMQIPLGYHDSFRSFKLTDETQENKEAIFDQIYHNKPLIGGWMTYIDNKSFSWFENQPLLQKIINCQNNNDCMPFSMEEMVVLTDVFKLKYIYFYDFSKYQSLLETFRKSYQDRIEEYIDGENLLIYLI